MDAVTKARLYEEARQPKQQESRRCRSRFATSSRYDDSGTDTGAVNGLKDRCVTLLNACSVQKILKSLCHERKQRTDLDDRKNTDWHRASHIAAGRSGRARVHLACRRYGWKAKLDFAGCPCPFGVRLQAVYGRHLNRWSGKLYSRGYRVGGISAPLCRPSPPRGVRHSGL